MKSYIECGILEFSLYLMKKKLHKSLLRALILTKFSNGCLHERISIIEQKP